MKFLVWNANTDFMDEPQIQLKRQQTAREFNLRIRMLVHLAATIAGLYVCYLMALPFLSAFTWALTLAILFYPAHKKIRKRIRTESLAALVTVLAATFIVVVPTVIMSVYIIDEASKGALLIENKLESGEWRHALQDHGLLFPNVQRRHRRLIDKLDLPDLDIPGMIGNAVAWLANMSASLVRISITKLIVLLLTFYFLFYFLRDRHSALRMLCGLSPLSVREMNLLFVRVADTVHATMYGTFVVAAVQGALGGLMFYWLDLPAPILWGAIMGLLAIIPVLGAFVIWIPAALFLGLDGSWFDALILTVWGTVVIGSIDNLLYPILVGNRLKLHTVPAFIAILGGLIMFGSSGIILGPIVLTVTLFLLEVWRGKSAYRLPE